MQRVLYIKEAYVQSIYIYYTYFSRTHKQQDQQDKTI